MITGLVNRIIPFSSVDGPGNRTAVFLQGCNFNCRYCHNPETINVCNSCLNCITHCPAGALSEANKSVLWDKNKCKNCDMCLKACNRDSSPKTIRMTVDEVVDRIKKVRPFISGITVSGGECTLQPEFLTALLKEAKKLELSTCVDTNGSVPFWEMPELTEVTDMAMVDIKSFQADEHMMLTGNDNTNVIKNVEFLSQIDKLFEIRTVIVPDLLRNRENVNSISRMISSIDPDIRYKLIKYRPSGVRQEKMMSRVPSAEMMEELVQTTLNNGCKNIVVT